MLLKELEKFPPEITSFMRIASKIAGKLGVKIYLVGGIVRDLIIDREIFDYDIVVEGDGIEFTRLIADYLEVDFIKHKTFGTATVYYKNYKIDVATCRKEYYSCWGALPKVTPSSLRDDLYRRDFTINAMAIGLNKDDYGELLDFYNGYNDLKNGLIRVLHDRSFLDDPTRIFRAIRFEKRFGFRIESRTLRLLKQALEEEAIKFVDEHRIRDEIILIFKEDYPPKYIRRIDELMGFSFIDKDLKFDNQDYILFMRIHRAIKFFYQKSLKYHKLQEWLIYLLGITIKLSKEKVEKFCSSFGFRRGEKKILTEIFVQKRIIHSLKREVKIRKIISVLKPMSFEAIVFFYAYFNNKSLNKNILYFLNNLENIKINVRGSDLKALNFKPQKLYGKILEELVYVKLEKNLVTKEEELEEAKKVFKRLIRSYSK
ncbi:MAG: hypothetical protein NC822_03060 [Candidatus Omnitrophica bacterium]|nr:hypothetical protein [Candidatus Omnitrophota bacterium]